MKTYTKYKGLTGETLLTMVKDDLSCVDIDGDCVLLIPRVKTFSNVAEIATKDDADFVSVETRDNRRYLVTV